MTPNSWPGIAALCLVVALTAERTAALPSADMRGLPLQTAASRGECVLTGRIVDGEAMPVDRATVKLVGSDGPGARIAVTDSAGRFTFAGLAAGSFAISAGKAGYVTTFYGSPRPGRGPAVPVALAAGQPMAVSMTLLHAAAVSGTITGEFGQPMPQVQVQVKPVSGRGATDTPTATTDNQGAYRILGLAPGDYVVAAMLPNASSAAAKLVTDEEVKWALQELSRGRVAGAPTGRSAASPPAGPIVAYAPVYFPGTTALDQAARITLSAGEERGGLTFSLRFITTSTISGTVVTPSGTPTPATLFLLPKSSGAPSGVASTVDAGLTRPVPVSEDGRFAIPTVPPGFNTLVARWDPDIAARVTGPSAATRWGELDVQTDGRDVRDVVITLHPGAMVTGTVRFESKAGAMPPESGNVRVWLSPARVVPTGLTGNLSAPIGPTGAFAFPSLMPGSYAVKVAPASIPGPNGAQWTLKSVTAAEHDITDGYLEVRPGDDPGGHSQDVALTLTDQQTVLSGVLFDAANRPTAAFSVVVFSATPAFWTRESRRVRAAQPATDGTFRIAGLPPGAYYVVAVADLDSDALGDPESLERLRQSAFKLTLADGEKRSLDLRIGGG